VENLKSSNLFLFIETSATMKAAKQDTSFAIHTTLTFEQVTTIIKISNEYKEFQDVFEKNNVDILPKYCPYNCAIDLQERIQPPFGPIYNLS